MRLFLRTNFAELRQPKITLGLMVTMLKKSFQEIPNTILNGSLQTMFINLQVD